MASGGEKSGDAQIRAILESAQHPDAATIARETSPGDAGDPEGESPAESFAEDDFLLSGLPVPDCNMEVVKDCAGLDHSDTDNGKRLRVHFGNDLRVLADQGAKQATYATWAGKYWDVEQGNARALALAQQLGDRITLEAFHLEPSDEEAAAMRRVEELRKQEQENKKQGRSLHKADEDELKQMEKVAAQFAKRRIQRVSFGKSSKNVGRLNAMLVCLAPHVMTAPDDFNADPLRFATGSHTLTFSRKRTRTRNPDWDNPDNANEDTPEFITVTKAELAIRKGHARSDLLTAVLPVEYDPKAKCPKWEAFLATYLPDDKVPGLRAMVQVTSGLGLIGVTVQRLFFHYGSGANGKSVFMEVLSRILGHLATSLPATSFTGPARQGGGASPDLARLYGRHLLRVKELPEGEPLQEALVKELTGGEDIQVRNLFAGYFDFRPVFTAHMSGNNYPRITGTDEGIWRRMAVVHWPVTIPESERRDFEEVVSELMTEAPGILNWLIEGAKTFLAEGLQLPPCVTEKTAEYREQMDPLSGFMRDCIQVTKSPEDQITSRDLYTLYMGWCVDAARKPLGETTFGRNMLKKAEILGFEKAKTAKANMWRGITRTDYEPPPAASGKDDFEGHWR